MASKAPCAGHKRAHAQISLGLEEKKKKKRELTSAVFLF